VSRSPGYPDATRASACSRAPDSSPSQSGRSGNRQRCCAAQAPTPDIDEKYSTSRSLSIMRSFGSIIKDSRNGRRDALAIPKRRCQRSQPSNRGCFFHLPLACATRMLSIKASVPGIPGISIWNLFKNSINWSIVSMSPDSLYASLCSESRAKLKRILLSP
jgi:hypothetical protein